MVDYSKANRVLGKIRLSVLRYLKGYAATVTSLGGLSAGATAFINATVAGSPTLTAVFGVSATVFAVANPILVVVARNITPEELARFEAALDAGDVGAVADQLVSVVNSFAEVHPDAETFFVPSAAQRQAADEGIDGIGAHRVGDAANATTLIVIDQNGTDGEQR